MSVLALFASFAFILTREPLVLETARKEKMVLQASHLSNVHEYFNTTHDWDGDPCSLSYRESFKSTLLRYDTQKSSNGKNIEKMAPTGTAYDEVPTRKSFP